MRKILIVDDEEINRDILQFGFDDLYAVEQAQNGDEAIDIIATDPFIAAILLDINMPGRNGYDVMEFMKRTGQIEKIPVFIITGDNNDEELERAYDLGAVAILNKPFNIRFLRRQVSNTVELFDSKNNLERLVHQKSLELVRQNNRLVEAMADIVEFRSLESGTHVKSVSGYTRLLMEGLVTRYKEYKVLYPDIESITFASCLHDIGKISVPDCILNKPGRFDEKDFEVMKEHTINGYQQILTLKDIMDPKLYKYSLDIARHHHERYGGEGYPDKLKGDDITIWSQVVGLADAYDALTRERCYKPAYDHETACRMIENGECGTFNPKVMETFESLKDYFKALEKKNREAV